ncbi:hypothetical protein T484DRAFT_1972164 [Baffinella frigidus]|nr:hypothetical protein T484DRAFT_1972164 [Cryptophyta sp. CCMP2293]
MLLDAWDQVAGFGIETIKNLQTHVGLGASDDGNDAQSQGNVETWFPPSHLVSAIKKMAGGRDELAKSRSPSAVKESVMSSRKMLAVKEEHGELAKVRTARQVELAAVVEQLGAVNGHASSRRGGDLLGAANDAQQIRHLKKRLGAIRKAIEKAEPRWAYLQEKVEGYTETESGLLPSKPKTESFKFRKSWVPAHGSFISRTPSTHSSFSRCQTGETSGTESSPVPTTSPVRAAVISPGASRSSSATVKKSSEVLRWS